MRSYEKLSTFGPSPGKTLSGRKNAPFCARQVCHGVTDVPNFGTSVTVGTEIRPGSRSYFPTLGAHRLPLRESAARANEECYGSRQDERSSIRHPRLLSIKGLRPLLPPAPLKSLSDFVFAKVPGPRRSAGADFATLYPPHGSRRHACCLVLPGQPGSKRAILRAPMALKNVRLAAADYGNGRRRCPQPLPAAQEYFARRLITRGSRRKSYIPAVTAPTQKTP